MTRNQDSMITTSHSHPFSNDCVEHLWATSPKHKIVFYSVYLEFFHTSVFFAFTLSAKVFKYPRRQATDVYVLELYMELGVVAYASNPST